MTVAGRGGAPLTVVVDAGLDDGVALAVLCGLGVGLAEVVVTEGSTRREVGAVATARLLATIGVPTAVVLGACEGLDGPYPDGRDPFHGTDAFAGHAHRLTAAEPLSRGWSDLDGDVLVTGALTVVARAILDGRPPRSVTWMGGSVAAGGNMTAAAEFNAWMDPRAADVVLSSAVPTTMIPLDVTTGFRWGAAEVRRLASLAGPASILAGPVGALVGRDGSFVPHDAVAAVAVVAPELFDWEERHVRCEAEGRLARGATIVDRRRRRAPAANTLVAAQADRDAVTAAIFDALASL